MDASERNIRATMDMFDLSRSEAEEVEKMREQPCSQCGRPKGAKLHARDHHHLSGKFRDVLCLRCNVILGLADEKPETLRALADYLERPPSLPHDQLINFHEGQKK